MKADDTAGDSTDRKFVSIFITGRGGVGREGGGGGRVAGSLSTELYLCDINVF